MLVLKVGYIVFFSVVKALPDYDSYLCRIHDSQVFALLPKKFARREFRVGESDFAAIFRIEGSRVTLSQVSVHYTRRVLEYVLSPCLNELNLKIKKSAWITSAKYRKVAIEPLNGDIKDSFELHKVLRPFLDKIDLSKYFNEKIGFVRYSRDIKEYVKNALCPPGDPDRIYKIAYHRDLNKVDVLVDSSATGLVVGKGMVNLILAKKLCRCEIEVIGIRTHVFNSFRKKEEPWKILP